MNSVHDWQNFYVIVGSAAGALIGLQFVVMTLLSNMTLSREQLSAGSTFSTPTIIHFGTALSLSAVACAPWHGVHGLSAVWALMGAAGTAYVVRITRKMAAQTQYKPVLEDWMFHSVLPFSSYAALVVPFFAPPAEFVDAEFGVAAAALVLLFVGIHNAWDIATFHLIHKNGLADKRDEI